MTPQALVDVLSVLDAFARRTARNCEACVDPIACTSCDLAKPLLEARDAVSELIEAVIENREAEQAFANNGEPDNYRRWDASERRLLQALANVGATP